MWMGAGAHKAPTALDELLALDGYGGSQESLFLKGVAVGRLLRAPVDGPTLGYTHIHTLRT